MTLFLKDDDVRQCVAMDDMLEAIEAMQHHFGHGEAVNLPRRKMVSGGSLLSVMGGGLFYQGVVGVKTYTVVSGTYSFHISLYDADTGRLLCYTQANRLGQLRTGATTGVAVKHLANPDAAVAGVIGTGNQAPTQLEALCRVRNIKRVKAFSRSEERREAFAKAMTETLGVEVTPADSSRAAIEGSDVVVAVAATMSPVLEGDYLGAGVTAIGAGPTTWRAHESDEAVFQKADKIFVDSAEQAPLEAGDMAAAVDRGLLQWSRLQELRHAVAGVVPGRDRHDQVIFAKLMGTGVADVAAAKLAYDRAKALGFGVEMDF